MESFLVADFTKIFAATTEYIYFKQQNVKKGKLSYPSTTKFYGRQSIFFKNSSNANYKDDEISLSRFKSDVAPGLTVALRRGPRFFSKPSPFPWRKYKLW